MLRLLDTSVAILLRDLDPKITRRVASLDRLPILSVLTVVELESGVAQAAGGAKRRQAVDVLLETLEILPFGPDDAAAYGRIVSQLGFSRPKVIDRMIAAQAIRVGAALATLNARDFRDIPGVNLEIWS